MSLETWKQEFYPVEADQVPPDQALDHSIKKWEGLQPSNLAKHSVRVGYKKVEDDNNRMIVDASTCALCQHYSHNTGCAECPIRDYKDLSSADVADDDEACLNEYCQFLKDKDTKPMFQLLQTVKANQ